MGNAKPFHLIIIFFFFCLFAAKSAIYHVTIETVIFSRTKIQWKLYSGDTLGTKGSVPWIEVSLEWWLVWDLLIINQQVIFLYIFCLGICCSNYFKQLDNVSKIMINLSLRYCMLNCHKRSTSILFISCCESCRRFWLVIWTPNLFNAFCG